MMYAKVPFVHSRLTEMQRLSTLGVALWRSMVHRLLRSVVGGLLVAVLAQSPALMAAPPAAASVPAMGVILQAQRANVGNGPATTGSTIFDGDLLQTEKDGTMRVRLGSSQAYLFNYGAATVHQSPDGFSANLTRGGIVLSSASGQKFSLVSDGATIQPSTSQPTVAVVTWVSPKELLVASSKGPLSVTMGDETKTVADGSSYKMIIDPAAAAAAAPTPGSPAVPQATRTGSNLFLLVLLGATVIAVTVGVVLAVESPSGL